MIESSQKSSSTTTDLCATQTLKRTLKLNKRELILDKKHKKHKKMPQKFLLTGPVMSKSGGFYMVIQAFVTSNLILSRATNYTNRIWVSLCFFFYKSMNFQSRVVLRAVFLFNFPHKIFPFR